MVGLDVVQLIAVGEQADRQIIHPQRLLERRAGAVVVAQPAAGFIVKCVGVAGPEVFAHLFAAAVVGVVHGDSTGLLDLAHSVGGAVDELLGGTDVEGVADGVVAANHAADVGQAMVRGGITVGADAGRGDVGGAVAGLVVLVGVDGGLGRTVAGFSQAAEWVVDEASSPGKAKGRTWER